MASTRNSSPESIDSGGPPTVEDLVPTPIFSGKVRFNAPSAISFAPATTKFATPMTHGTLMADFAVEPQVLRGWRDVFLAEGFTELVITWPGLEGERKVSMADIIEGKNHISRAELAQFVMDQFSLFAASTTGVSSCTDPEWRLGEAPDAYNVKNTCLAFLWSPAPGVWQPAFRIRNKDHDINGESSVS